MDSALKKVPQHLKKYVVEQNYQRYTPEDQAVWRYIMRQLKAFLSVHAHECYVDGLERTGISIEQIPRIEDVHEKLSQFGWGAVPVSGFIPPAAFMEFQSLSLLPIASDMRTLDHLLYTPAPDIVHEAAGHAPILVDPDFAEYLKRYAKLASHSIVNKVDLDQYEAIRLLSDLKESPASTREEIDRAERNLIRITESIGKVSEAGLLSRMNWWTAEYGLIGDLKQPKIFGAGLLSSLGEARECLRPQVKKIPLDVSCIEYSYDITEPQPQLFVTPDFQTLHQVLEDLAKRLSFTIGGAFGLKNALESETVNTIELNSGLQISGQLAKYILDDDNQCIFFKTAGPTQLSVQKRQLPGQGVEDHAQGYSTPIGALLPFGKDLYSCSASELESLSLREGKSVDLKYVSGFNVKGEVTKLLFEGTKLILVALKNCTVRRGDEIYFEPSWGVFDLATGSRCVSVFGGPADRSTFPDAIDFAAQRVPEKKYSASVMERHKFYEKIRGLRETEAPQIRDVLPIVEEYKSYIQATSFPSWLLGVEIYELLRESGASPEELQSFQNVLQKLQLKSDEQNCLQDGISLPL